MRDRTRTWVLAAALLSLSALMYLGLHALFPGRTADIEFYTLLDIAFIPLSAILVGLLIEGMLAARERAALLHKMNMVIGAFFSQLGRELLDALRAFDAHEEEDRPHLLFRPGWTARDFAAHRAAIVGDDHPMDISASDLFAVREILERERPFVLQLLQNGNLLEHETFTDMLWAVSHLSEELAARRDLAHLTAPDARHIEMDMARAYGRLLGEYLLYVQHLKADYPYLFSFAMRTNPFDPDADAEVRG